MMQFNYTYLLNHLKISTARRHYFFEVLVTPKVLDFLHLLQELNVIRRFYRIRDNRYRVHPSWSYKSPTYRKIKLYNRGKNPLTIHLAALSVLQHSTANSALILSTPHGLITHKEALRRKTGGQLVCLIF